MTETVLRLWISKLPKSPEGHWGMGHLPVVNYIKKEVFDKCDTPSMMEIGLNNGTSASMWLFMCPKVTLQSIDIGLHHFIDKVADILRGTFPERFFFYKSDSQKLHLREWPVFDLIFIDGGHKHDVCLSDLKFALKHARYILLDDTGGNSPGVTSALKEFPLENFQLLKDWKIGAGCRLYKNFTLA